MPAQDPFLPFELRHLSVRYSARMLTFQTVTLLRRKRDRNFAQMKPPWKTAAAAAIY